MQEKVLRANGVEYHENMGLRLFKVTDTLYKSLDGKTTYCKQADGSFRAIKKNRNEKCDCNSGKKFKKCCGMKA